MKTTLCEKMEREIEKAVCNIKAKYLALAIKRRASDETIKKMLSFEVIHDEEESEN